jgi:hypothetical protein
MLKANKNLMTIAIIGAITTTLLLTSNQGFAQERGHKGDPARKAVKQFNRLDTNDDEQLALEELSTSIQSKAENKLINKDSDEDGFLSFEEASTDQTDLSGIADEIVQCVTDTKTESGNENIIVPETEKFLSPQDKFSNADTSGDSLLDLAELQAAASEKVSHTFVTMDIDENALISLDEFLAYKQQRQATRRATKSCVDELLDDEEI